MTNCPIGDFRLGDNCNITMQTCTVGSIIPADIEDAEDRLADLECRLDDVVANLEEAESLMDDFETNLEE